MKYMLVVVFSVYLIRIQTENINVYPGRENLYSIFPGDTLALQCPVNSFKKSPVRWSYINGKLENLLSIGDKINKNETHFRWRIELGSNHLKNVTFLMIYNITSKDQKIFKCYFSIVGGNQRTLAIAYEYNILLANVTQSLIKKPNGDVCCVLHGQSIRSLKFIWEQRTLYDEHIRFIKIVQKNNSGTSERSTDETMRKHNHLRSCLDLNTNGISKYEKEGEYMCITQVYLYGRNLTINKTASIKIENIQDRPFCIQDTTSQQSILGSNITIALKFYSKPSYSALSLRRNDKELKLGDKSVNIKNISLDVYNVTVMVSGYEMIINITEFSEEDVGNYTVNITNEFGFCNCTVRLLFEDDININRYLSGNVIEGQSVLWICQSISRRTTNNYSWTWNGITLSNSSSLVLDRITQNDNGNYTCHMKNKQGYFTKNELLIVNPLSCTTCVTKPQGLQLLKRFLGIGYFILPFVLLVVTVFCNISIHLYCKKLKKVTLETDENEILREGIEMGEADNGYHTINEDNFRIEDTEIENQSEITSSVRASDIAEAPLPVPASGSNEQQIEEEDDYLHPYCTVMHNTMEIHEYKGIVPGIVERHGSDVVLNQELERLYEN